MPLQTHTLNGKHETWNNDNKLSCDSINHLNQLKIIKNGYESSIKKSIYQPYEDSVCTYQTQFSHKKLAIFITTRTLNGTQSSNRWYKNSYNMPPKPSHSFSNSHIFLHLWRHNIPSSVWGIYHELSSCKYYCSRQKGHQTAGFRDCYTETASVAQITVRWTDSSLKFEEHLHTKSLNV